MSDSNVKTVLKQAKALISDEVRWIKGEMRRNENGVTCWCTLGALKEMGDYEIRNDARYAIANALPFGLDDNKSLAQNIATFNDDIDTTHADIMKLFDRAIEKN